MRIFGIGRLNRYKKNSAVFFLMLLFFFGFSLSIALGASGEDSGAKGWTSSDWFRVMNFAVLVIVLVFVLRKPLRK